VPSGSQESSFTFRRIGAGGWQDRGSRGCGLPSKLLLPIGDMLCEHISTKFTKHSSEYNPTGTGSGGQLFSSAGPMTVGSFLLNQKNQFTETLLFVLLIHNRCASTHFSDTKTFFCNFIWVDKLFFSAKVTHRQRRRSRESAVLKTNIIFHLG